jgi:hypothetical protein
MHGATTIGICDAPTEVGVTVQADSGQPPTVDECIKP